MRIPLIVAARITEDTIFPHVTLRPGRWTFSSTHSDSALRVKTPDSAVELHEELVLSQPTPVTLSCVRKGSETSITIFACLSL
jgi:hypothetical protein